MAQNINIAELREAPLTLRPSFPERHEDFTIVASDIVIGRIMRVVKSFNAQAWLWTITGPYFPPNLRPTSGEAETLDQAKADFNTKLQTWFTWAEQQRGTGVWSGAGPLTPF
jgi:hypothetical protein